MPPHSPAMGQSGGVPVTEMLVIDEIATWVSELVTESLCTWVQHTNAVHAATGAPVHHSAGPKRASDALRLAVADLTASLGAWMDGLTERRNAMAARYADTVSIEKALRAHGTLSVHIRSASGITTADPRKPPDTYADVIVHGMNKRTRAVHKTSSPQWDQALTFEGQLAQLIEKPMAVGVRQEGPGAAVLGQVILHLSDLLRDPSVLSASWEDLPLSTREGLTRGSLSMGVSFLPAALSDDVVLRQAGKLRLRIDRAFDLPLHELREQNCIIRVTAAGSQRQTAPVQIDISNEPAWYHEALSFEGTLADFALGTLGVEVHVQAPVGVAPDDDEGLIMLAAGTFSPPFSAPDLELMATEVHGVRTSVPLRPRGRVLLSYEWTETAQVPVAEELHRKYPLLRPALRIRQQKQEVPIEVLLEHPSGRSSFRAFLAAEESYHASLARERRASAKALDCYLAIRQHMVVCSSASHEGPSSSPSRVKGASAHAVFSRYLKAESKDMLEPPPPPAVVQALTVAMLKGEYSAFMFADVTTHVLGVLAAGGFRRYVNSSYFSELLRALSRSPVHEVEDDGPGIPAYARPKDPFASPSSARTGPRSPALHAYDALRSERFKEGLTERRSDDLRRLQELRRQNADELAKYRAAMEGAPNGTSDVHALQEAARRAASERIVASGMASPASAAPYYRGGGGGSTPPPRVRAPETPSKPAPPRSSTPPPAHAASRGPATEQQQQQQQQQPASAKTEASAGRPGGGGSGGSGGSGGRGGASAAGSAAQSRPRSERASDERPSSAQAPPSPPRQQAARESNSPAGGGSGSPAGGGGGGATKAARSVSWSRGVGARPAKEAAPPSMLRRVFSKGSGKSPTPSNEGSPRAGDSTIYTPAPGHGGTPPLATSQSADAAGEAGSRGGTPRASDEKKKRSIFSRSGGGVKL